MEYAAMPLNVQRDPLRRVEKAFKGFFRCIKAGHKSGYPRFRSSARYNSFSVESSRFTIGESAIKIVKLGHVKFRTRCRIRGIPKQLHVKRIGNKWNAVVVCDIGLAPDKIAVSKAVGIDVGLTSLAVLSDGTEVANPRWAKQFETKMSQANRSFARKRKGSKNSAKARERLQRLHRRITGRRKAYLHSVSAILVSGYDLIAFEKLNIAEMSHGRFAKFIMDAAWRELLSQIVYKAEEAGKHAIAVNPRGTTQTCSGCGEIVPKKIWHRQHDCPKCGLSLSRDHNAALNILTLGMSVAGD